MATTIATLRRARHGSVLSPHHGPRLGQVRPAGAHMAAPFHSFSTQTIVLWITANRASAARPEQVSSPARLVENDRSGSAAVPICAATRRSTDPPRLTHPCLPHAPCLHRQRYSNMRQADWLPVGKVSPADGTLRRIPARNPQLIRLNRAMPSSSSARFIERRVTMLAWSRSSVGVRPVKCFISRMKWD